MDILNREELTKQYLDKTSRITNEVVICFDSLYKSLDQICQEVDGIERKPDVRCFVTALVNLTANQLLAFNKLVNESLLAQLKAELSA